MEQIMYVEQNVHLYNYIFDTHKIRIDIENAQYNTKTKIWYSFCETLKT